MGLFDKIKDAIWGTPDLTPTPEHDPVEEAYLGTHQAGSGFTPEVESPAANDDRATRTPGPAEVKPGPESRDAIQTGERPR